MNMKMTGEDFWATILIVINLAAFALCLHFSVKQYSRGPERPDKPTQGAALASELMADTPLVHKSVGPPRAASSKKIHPMVENGRPIQLPPIEILTTKPVVAVEMSSISSSSIKSVSSNSNINSSGTTGSNVLSSAARAPVLTSVSSSNQAVPVITISKPPVVDKGTSHFIPPPISPTMREFEGYARKDQFRSLDDLLAHEEPGRCREPDMELG